MKDAAAALRDVYKNYAKYITKAREGRKWVYQYDCTNPDLQNLYLTLIKPKQVMLGSENAIKNGVITTDSFMLYQKYKQIIESNQDNSTLL